MHILEICSGILHNGAMAHCLMVGRELVRRGHRVSLACLPEAWITTQLPGTGIEHVASDLHRWPTDELRRMRDYAQRERVDILHSHMSRANFFGVLLRWMTGVPAVATAHSRHFQLHWMLNDHVVAVSEATRRYHIWRNMVWPSRIDTIHGFVDCEAIVSVPPETRSRVRAEFGLDDDMLAVGAIGEVMPRKGQLHLVEALPTVLASLPRTRLVVIGKPKITEYAERCRRRAEELGVAHAIHWAGHRSDVRELLRGLDLVTLASVEESLPISLLEAMTAGLPVVATTAGGIGECVADERTGLLVPPADSRALAAALLRLLGDGHLRRRFGEAGRERALAEFSLTSQTAALESLFQRVLARRGRSLAA